jgi:hypothetical protein
MRNPHQKYNLRRKEIWRSAGLHFLDSPVKKIKTEQKVLDPM